MDKKGIRIALVVIVSLLGPIAAPAAGARLTPGQIEAARRGALEILVQARVNDATAAYGGVLGALYAKLKGAVISAPDDGMDFTNCGRNTLAFVQMHQDQSSIWLCALSLEGSVAKLEQTLVHETGHLIGNEDECDASRIELAVMKLSGASLQYKNKYLERCGLAP